MSVINGSLFDGIVRFHSPMHQANTAVMVIDELDSAWPGEKFENYLAKKQNQQETLRFCKDLGCRVITVRFPEEPVPKHIHDIIEKPDFSCVKQTFGVLESRTKPPLMEYINRNKITSLVIMGGAYACCVKDSLIGGCLDQKYYSGLLNRQITVLSSPKLLSPYLPEIYTLEPKFNATEIAVQPATYKHHRGMKWPLFTLHPGMRFYTKIQEYSNFEDAIYHQFTEVHI